MMTSKMASAIKLSYLSDVTSSWEHAGCRFLLSPLKSSSGSGCLWIETPEDRFCLEIYAVSDDGKLVLFGADDLEIVFGLSEWSE